jgi:hypothetical protein
VSQESPARLDPEGVFKHFLQGLEAYAPVVLGWLEVARAAEQQLRTLAEKAMPSLVALAQIDWAAKSAEGASVGYGTFEGSYKLP